MGRPASGNQNTKCTMLHSVVRLLHHLENRLYMLQKNYMTVILLTGWISNLSIVQDEPGIRQTTGCRQASSYILQSLKKGSKSPNTVRG